jgi:hypothetical protein
LVRVLRSVVQILRAAVLHTGHQPAVRRPVAAQLVGDQHSGHILQALQKLAKEPGRGLGVSPGGDQNVQHIPVLVDGTPEVVGLASDRDEHLVQVPLVAWAGSPAA